MTDWPVNTTPPLTDINRPSTPTGNANCHLSYYPVSASNTLKNYTGKQPAPLNSLEPQSVTTSKVQNFYLWVTKIQQDNQLQGNSYQSRLTRHFYPKSYGPGDYIITAITKSQKDYQDFAQFIRGHHKSLMSGQAKAAKATYSGYSYLMNLQLFGEGIYLQGWIPRITLTKKGVFDPVPLVTFNFTIGWDFRSRNPVDISTAIRQWYGPSQSDIRDISPPSNPPGTLPHQ